MRVGVLGINHKLANLGLREVLAKTCQKRLGHSHTIHGEHSFLLLSTCNRTEIYFSSEDLAASHSYLLNILRNEVAEDFDQKLYSYFGKDCLHHLSRVAAGLDSAIVAETEIQGQVRMAYEAAQEQHALPYELHYLFQKTLGISKKVRSVLPQVPGLPNIEHAVFGIGQHVFKQSKNVNILFIGASEINERVLNYLTNKGMSNISLCNRSQEHCHPLAEKYGIACKGWNEIVQWPNYDWVILGTKAPDFLIKSTDLTKGDGSKKLIIDLAVPRNAEPTLAHHPKITLFNLDQLNRHLQTRNKKMVKSLLSAEALTESLVAKQIEMFNEKEQHRLKFALASA